MFNAETLNDNMLVQKFIDGDQFALEELINRHKNRVFTYIVLIVKNHQLAEDIFQDTFIKVIRSLKTGKYTENGKFVSWVLRIAHNLIIDHFRKENCLAQPLMTILRLTYLILKNIQMKILRID